MDRLTTPIYDRTELERNMVTIILNNHDENVPVEKLPVLAVFNTVFDAARHLRAGEVAYPNDAIAWWLGQNGHLCVTDLCSLAKEH